MNFQQYFLFGMVFFMGFFIEKARTDDVRFKQLTIKEGLSQSRVSAIVQDSKGFIWIGTEDGLNRYDGYEVEVFSFNPQDTLSISNQVINSLAADEAGNVWIGSGFGGLNKYSSKNGKFVAYRYDPDKPQGITSGNIISISRGNRGNLWLSSNVGGFDYFDTQAGMFTHYRHDPNNSNSLIDDRTIFIHNDSRNTVWIATLSGLDRFYPGTGKFRHYSLIADGETAPSRQIVTCVYENREGLILFGTDSDGIYRFDPRTEKFTNFKLEPGNPDSPSNQVTAILEDRSGFLWIGTLGNGLYRAEKYGNGITQFLSHPSDHTSLSQDFITALFEDLTGEIWVGTDLNGVSKIDRSATKFKAFNVPPVRAFWLDDDGILWLGMAGQGLDRVDRANNRVKSYRYNSGDKRGIPAENIRAIYKDSEGIFWLASNRGLIRFDSVKEVFDLFRVSLADPFDQANILNYNIVELPDLPGVIWFGSSGGGLCRFDKKSKELTQIFYRGARPDSISANFVRAVAPSKLDPKILWIGSFLGVSRFNIETGEFHYYSNDPDNPKSLSSNNIMDFFEDDNGYLWISTYGGGLNRFNPKTEEFVVFTTQNSGLPSNSIYGLLPDNHGNFWLSSNRGISKFNPATNVFKNFTVDDGLQSDEFNGGGFYLGDTGEMFFGGIGGYNAFFPESIEDNPFPPRVVLTDFKLFNQSVPIGNESPLNQHISETRHINLAHWQNDISIEYVAIHYYRSVDNSYAYMLENYDTDWQYVGSKRFVNYTNLDPGDYTFRVKAANSDGVWNETGTTVKITIQSPWWETNWAYAGYGIMFVTGLFGVDRIQRFRLTQRERNKAQIREAELRAKVAESENARKSKELEEARHLQLSLLPEKLPDLPNLEIAVYMKTATEVGGDYYDYNISADGTLNIALGDATGHGMRAGTVVTLMKGLFSADSGRMDIASFFRQSSETIKELRFGRMMMAFILLKIKDKNLLFSSAGMPPALLYRHSKLSLEEIAVNGLPLGAMKNSEYLVKQDTLASGDTLLLMSDGLPELKNPAGEMFDYPRVQQIFGEVAEKSSQEIIDRLSKAADLWRKNTPPDDDITLMVIKIH